MTILLTILVMLSGITALLTVMSRLTSDSITKSKRCKHTFITDEVINLRIDPKCTKCGTPLSQAT